MIIETKTLKWYNQLIELQELIKQDFNNWLLKYKFEDRVQVQKFENPEVYPEYSNITGDMDDYHRPENIKDKEEGKSKEYWFCDPILTNRGNIKCKYYEDWKTSADFAVKIPGLVQYIVNFVRPNTKLPMHDDSGGWKRQEKDLGIKLNGFTNVFGLQANGNNSYFEFGKTNSKHPLNTGEWITFEGKTHEHNVVNNSSIWRVTAVVDFLASEYNLSIPETKYLNHRWNNYNY